MLYKELIDATNKDRKEEPVKQIEGGFEYKGRKIIFNIMSPKDLKSFAIDKSYMRSVDKNHVKNISRAFMSVYKSDHFTQFTYPVCLSVRENGKKVIIDGQHRVQSAIATNKSVLVLEFYNLTVDEELKIYMINNNMKVQSPNHRMDLLSRMDSNVRRVYDILDKHLVGWDAQKPKISRVNFIGSITFTKYTTAKKDIKTLPAVLEDLPEFFYDYYDQVIGLLCEGIPYSEEYGEHKKSNVKLNAKTYWERSELFMGVFRFVIYFHMRFGNKDKVNAELTDFLAEVDGWQVMYDYSKEDPRSERKYVSIVCQLVELYNKNKRSSSQMLPPYHMKMFDKNQFPYHLNFYQKGKVNEAERVEIAVKKKVKNIKKGVKT